MEKPLSRDDLKYVDSFRRTRDVTKAGQRIHLGPWQAKRLHDRIEIQEEIERQDNIVMTERAKVQVAAEGLTNDLLDSELMKLILLDAEKSPDAKRRSIELGYVLTGRIESGNTRSLEAKEGPDAKPNFYQAFVQVGGTVTVSPILPEANKDHAFPIAPPPGDDILRQRVRELTTPKTVTGTVQSEKPKVRVF